ncbi:hypothetical protein [Dyella sp. 2RAB6]|uniref:hypothetical protein n=1 Tax=Dyella sp. 2RAB6 TaxID=3232992 RepID=UPI003F931A0F
MATIDELRDHLFATIKALRDPANPMELDRAKTIAEVSQVVINSAKVEVEAMRVTGGISATGFLPTAAKTITSGDGSASESPIDRARAQRQIMREKA